MRCEVIAVGTELLLGQIVDSNSAWIGEQLALAGIDSHFQTKVGDNLGRIVACLRLALERSDAVILCGGLGPTQDDITREAIAEVMGVPLVRSPAMAERIRALFELLETKKNLIRLIELVQKAQGVQIFIGSENELFGTTGCSVVVAPYEAGQQEASGRAKIVGAIGVIGPMRMNYARIIPMVDYTARVVSRLLGSSDQELRR